MESGIQTSKCLKPQKPLTLIWSKLNCCIYKILPFTANRVQALCRAGTHQPEAALGNRPAQPQLLLPVPALPPRRLRCAARRSTLRLLPLATPRNTKDLALCQGTRHPDREGDASGDGYNTFTHTVPTFINPYHYLYHYNTYRAIYYIFWLNSAPSSAAFSAHPYYYT